MFKTDFSHGVSTYSLFYFRKVIDEFDGVDSAVGHQMFYQNAADLYGF